MSRHAPPPTVSPVDAARSASLSAHHVQRTQQLDAYYDRTKLLAVLEDFVRALTQRYATRRLVPTNPYTVLLAHLRRAEISAAELLVSPRPRDLKTLSIQEVLLFDPQDGRVPRTQDNQIATFKPPPPMAIPTLAVWATRGTIERIPYSSDWQRGADGIYGLVSPWLAESDGADEGCGLYCTGAMVGPNVFFLGTNNRHTAAAVLVEVERHVIVSSSQHELAMEVFARQQIRSLFEATKKHNALTLANGEQLMLAGPCAIGISSRRESRPSGGGGNASADSMWTLERTSANRQGFITAVKMALVAAGSFTMDLLYEHRVGSSTEEVTSRIVRCKVGFFFHFDCLINPSQPNVPRQGSPAANRSFLELSLVREVSLFWTSRGANEITRRALDQGHRDAELVPGSSTQASPSVDVGADEASLLADLMRRVCRLARTNAETRHWMRLLQSSEALRLLQIVSLVDLMQVSIRSVAATRLSSLLHATVVMYDEHIHQLIQDSLVGRTSSLLHGLHGILKELCTLPDDPLHPNNVDVLYQRLQQSQEALSWLAGAAIRDFCELVQRTTTAFDELDQTACADLREDISIAIEMRRFPPAIVAESVFAQYMVETNLDVALERALVSTVTSGLPPNPFIPFCCHLRVTACEFLNAAKRERTLSQSLADDEVSVRSVDDGLFAIDLAKPLTAQYRSATLVAANDKLLTNLSIEFVLAIHHFLHESQVYRITAYHPAKATYSARVVTSLIVDDPLLASRTSTLEDMLLQSIEVVEHVVIEGKEGTQALQFFADAVRRDVVRLLQRISDKQAEIFLLGPAGDVVTSVELHDTQVFEQLIVEATPKKCVLQVVLPPVVTPESAASKTVVRMISKTYVFRFSSTGEERAVHAASVGDVLQLRLRTFGVGFEVEAAQIVWGAAGTAASAQHDPSTLADFVARAANRHDSLLLSHLQRVAGSNQAPGWTCMDERAPTFLLRLLDTERLLEWLLLRLVYQQLTNLTPRSEAATLAAEAKTLLYRVVSIMEDLVLPQVQAMGMVDAQQVLEVIAQVRSLCGAAPTTIDANEAVTWAERVARRLWTLVLVVRFASQADMS